MDGSFVLPPSHPHGEFTSPASGVPPLLGTRLGAALRELELEIRREQSGAGTLLSPLGSSASPGCRYLGEKISLVKKKKE